MTTLRILVPLLLTMVAVAVVNLLMRRRGLVPPRFLPVTDPETGVLEPDSAGPIVRRSLAGLVLVAVLYLSVLSPLGAVGLDLTPDLNALRPAQLFTLHGLFGLALLGWYLLGFAPSAGVDTSLRSQFGLRAERVAREIGIGVLAGAGIWVGVISLLLLLSGLVLLFGGAEALPQEPPGMVLWIAGLPVWTRVAVSLSAGFFEETFFRGFLQPRVGIAVSTMFFSLAHLSYDQPFMLVGVTLLSLLFSWLVLWRQSIWAAVSAHATFDMIQLVIVIPLLTGLLDPGQGSELLVSLWP